MENQTINIVRKGVIYWGSACLGVFLTATRAFAQLPIARQAEQPMGEGTFVLTVPYFFVAVIAGLILAIAFELLLTNLSAAIGLNLAEGKLKPVNRQPNADKNEQKVSIEKRISDTLDSAHQTVMKINSWFGLWTIITAGISLFFACWISVLISGTFNVVLGALLGLVIWGFFYVILLTLEAKAVTSMVGALTATAKNALQSAYQSATAIFSKSGEKKSG